MRRHRGHDLGGGGILVVGVAAGRVGEDVDDVDGIGIGSRLQNQPYQQRLLGFGAG